MDALGTPEIMGIVTVAGALVANMVFVMVRIGKREEVIEHHKRNHIRHYMLSDQQTLLLTELDKRVTLLEDRSKREGK